MKAFLRSCLVLGVLGSEACVYSPSDGESIAYDRTTRIGTVDLFGYVDQPNRLLDVQLQNWSTGGWDTVAQVRSASTMAYAAGTFGAGSPATYQYPAPGTPSRITVVSPGLPNDAAHRRLGPYTDELRLRIVKNGTGEILHGGTRAQRDCFVSSSIGSTTNYLTIAQQCGYVQTDIDLWYSVNPVP